MQNDKMALLKNYLSLYISHVEVLKTLGDDNSPYVILDVRNAPNEAKKRPNQRSISLAC